MHYFKFNIGDYKSHTSHLDLLEDLAYRRLIEWQYLHEKPLPLDVEQVARVIAMRSECECITFVLDSFFERTDEGYINKRVFREIDEFREKSEKARQSVNARWKKAKNTNVLRPQCEGNTNHKPLTKNHKTLDKPDDVTDEVWSDFLALRKKQKADLTKTALTRLVSEAKKAGWSLDEALSECVTRGWRSFKAEWVNKGESTKGVNWE